MLPPLPQEMAVFKSRSRASCMSGTSCPCTNPGPHQPEIRRYPGGSLMGLAQGWREGCVAAEPLYAPCGGLWFELLFWACVWQDVQRC